MKTRSRQRFLRRIAASLGAFAALTASLPQASAIIDTIPAPTGVVGESSARIQLGNMNCTATLIAPQYLLTAKHCVGNGENSFISIGREHNGELHVATEVYLSPDRDLAVVKLDRPSGKPVAPLSGKHLTPQEHGTAIGWGGVGDNPFLPVQQSNVVVQRRVINVPGPEPEAVMVETWMQEGRIQRGDSGGPLFVNGELAGIAAMSDAGAGNSVNGTVGWYVPVAENLNWISRYAHIPEPPQQGTPSPLVDAQRFPTYAPEAKRPSIGSILLSIFPGMPYFPAISS